MAGRNMVTNNVTLAFADGSADGQLFANGTWGVLCIFPNPDDPVVDQAEQRAL